MTKLNDKIKKGIVWTFFNQIGGQLIFVVFNIFLSRLLGPRSYGIITMVTVFSGFASFFVDAGFGTAIVQKGEINDKMLSSVFWFNLFMGFVLYAIFFFAAPFIALFYHEKSLVALTRVICLTFVISSFTVVQSAILTRHLNFKRKAIVNWVSILVSYGVVFIMAFKGFGVWCIVAYNLFTPFVTAVLLWSQSKWRPSMLFSIVEIKGLSKFGFNVLGDTFINYWGRNADNFIIGKYLGSIELGFYTRAYSIMLLPMKNISSVISSVMFPAMSQMQNNIPLIKSYYLKTIKFVALICFPLMIGLSVLASDFTFVVFGSAWMPIASILRWLCLLAAFQSVIYLNNCIYRSTGRAQTAFRVSVIVTVSLVLSFIIGIYLGGLNGLVLAYFITSVITMLPIYHTALRLINTSLLEVALHLRAPLLGVTGMALAMLLLKACIAFGQNVLGLGLQVVAAMFFYCLLIWLLDKSSFVSLRKMFKI